MPFKNCTRNWFRPWRTNVPHIKHIHALRSNIKKRSRKKTGSETRSHTQAVPWLTLFVCCWGGTFELSSAPNCARLNCNRKPVWGEFDDNNNLNWLTQTGPVNDSGHTTALYQLPWPQVAFLETVRGALTKVLRAQITIGGSGERRPSDSSNDFIIGPPR